MSSNWDPRITPKEESINPTTENTAPTNNLAAIAGNSLAPTNGADGAVGSAGTTLGNNNLSALNGINGINQNLVNAATSISNYNPITGAQNISYGNSDALLGDFFLEIF